MPRFETPRLQTAVFQTVITVASGLSLVGVRNQETYAPSFCMDKMFCALDKMLCPWANVFFIRTKHFVLGTNHFVQETKYFVPRAKYLVNAEGWGKI